MANPLFEAISGRNPGGMPFGANCQAAPTQPNMMDAMSQLRNNPAQMIRNAGYNVPDEIINNPQAAVMHLLQTGQIRGGAMQRIQPLLSRLIGR